MDEATARQTAAGFPDASERMGLDAPIPEQYEGWKIPGVATELRRFPAYYVTLEVDVLLKLHRHHAAGRPIREDGLLHWPARLVQALDLIDREKARRGAHAGH